MTTGNGLEQATELPPMREAIIDQAHRLHQEVAHERDTLRRKLDQANADIAAYKVALEAQAAQLAAADSRVETMTIVRDEAVARRAEVETVLASMLALGRAFAIESRPLIRGAGDEDISSMSSNDRRLAMAGTAERYNAGDVG